MIRTIPAIAREEGGEMKLASLTSDKNTFLKGDRFKFCERRRVVGFRHDASAPLHRDGRGVRN